MYIDYWNVSKIVGDHWVQFFTEDHWNNVVSSNKFTLTIIPTSPAPAFNNLASILNYNWIDAVGWYKPLSVTKKKEIFEDLKLLRSLPF